MSKRKTMFRTVLVRTIATVVVITALYTAFLLPQARKNAYVMVARQGGTFANTTIAACGEALYRRDYATAIDYVSDVVSETPDVDFVRFTPFDGRIILVEGTQWSTRSKTGDDELTKAHAAPFGLEEARGVARTERGFEYSKVISIDGLKWGTIAVGLVATPYDEMLQDYYWNAFLAYLPMPVAFMCIFFSTWTGFRKQLLSLQEGAHRLAMGNYRTRARGSAIEEINALVSSFNDMADSIEEKAERINELAKVVEEGSDAVLIVDEELKIRFANEAMSKLAQTTRDELQTDGLESLGVQRLGFDEKLMADIVEKLHSSTYFPRSWDAEAKLPGGGLRYFSLRLDRLDQERDGKFNSCIIVADITKRKTLEKRLNTMAYYDSLTSLPNRGRFMENLRESVRLAKESRDNFALLFIDLDDFKVMNDSRGHDFGDEVLKQVADRLKRFFRGDDLVYRLGGDEFTALLRSVGERDDVRTVSQRLLVEIERPFLIDGETIELGASIGGVLYPDDGENGRRLLLNADRAMYEAKAAGKAQFRLFESERLGGSFSERRGGRKRNFRVVDA